MITSWSEKYLSSRAKKVLIKSVAQAIPTYMMSVFQLSASLCEDLERTIRKYWWGEDGDQRRTHWLAWEKFTRCKAEEDWVLEISKSLTRHCWPDKHGG